MGIPQTTVLIVDAPTNTAEQRVVEEFYKDRRNTLQDLPAHNFVTILDDFNARIGPEVANVQFRKRSVETMDF